MKKQNVQLLTLGLLCLILGFLAGIFFVKRGVPFVLKREQWTIGIFRGSSPFSFKHPLNLFNPRFKAEHVTDISAKFVADPFLVKEGNNWNLFFEAYNNETKQGDLAVATSTNTWTWDYQKVILDEPFHLSYPYVFKWETDYYLIPESFEANSIRLYKADSFPTNWSFVKTLVSGKDFVDNSIVYYQGLWYLFSSTTENDTLYLFFAENLLGPWKEHPSSPIVKGNNHMARPSGRMIVYEDQLYRYTMDVNPPAGTHQVMAIKITDISSTNYSEEPAGEGPVLQASGNGWMEQAMHQIDPVQIGPGSWIAAVDGFGEYLVFGWGY